MKIITTTLAALLLAVFTTVCGYAATITKSGSVSNFSLDFTADYPDALLPGDVINYTVVVKNTGADEITQFGIADTLHSVRDTPVSCVIPTSLPVGTSFTCETFYIVQPTDEHVCNYFYVQGVAGGVVVRIDGGITINPDGTSFTEDAPDNLNPMAAPTPEPTLTPTPTTVATPSDRPSPTVSQTPTETPSATAMPTPTKSSTPTPAATPTQEPPSPAATPSGEPTPIPSMAPTQNVVPTPSAVPSESPEPLPTGEPPVLPAPVSPPSDKLTEADKTPVVWKGTRELGELGASS